MSGPSMLNTSSTAILENPLVVLTRPGIKGAKPVGVTRPDQLAQSELARTADFESVVCVFGHKLCEKLISRS